MTTFEIPTLTTERLRLRAFAAGDLDAYAAMQANPEVMRFLVDGRTHTRVEVWRIIAGSLGSWPLRGYGMWACDGRQRQICRKHRNFRAAGLAGTGARLLTRTAILGSGFRDRGSGGGTRLAVRAPSIGAHRELHSAR
jgi:hypothetical protein